jgi:thiol-disulfide isomerase/thioredoxin
MMRYLILVLFLLPFKLSNAQAFADNMPEEEAKDWYFERMQFTESRQPDSAIYYARMMANQSSLSQTILRDYIQGIFAEQFLKQATLGVHTVELEGKPAAGAMRRMFLNKMVNDTSSLLSSLAGPLALWVKALDNQGQPVIVKDIVHEFLDHELNKQDMYFHYRCRYALLTWQLLIRNSGFDSLSTKLFNKINDRLTPYLSQPITALETTAEVRTICILKYLYASAQFIKAQSLVQEKKMNEAIQYFRLASKYSPDNTGLGLWGNFAYDILLLFGTFEKKSFREDYVDFLSANNGSKEEILSCLGTMTMIDPSYMQRLQDHYKTFANKSPSFNQYWMRFLSDQLDSVRSFSIKKINGSQFSSTKNKWTIVYFWGTWCGPCQREMPGVEAFYRDEILKNDSSQFEIITIACHDQEAKVKEFMKKNNYTFPVAMSDSKVEKLFPIPGYPTKILITPNGRYQVIPFGKSWQEFVKSYSGRVIF